jgi:zinc transport system permease protein
MDLFAYEFMQRAPISVLITGLAAPALGIYLVQRRLALIGDAIGHVAVTRVGLGLLTNNAPLLAAAVVCAVGAAYARVSGLPVRWLNILIAVLTAVTVAVAIRAVRLLLVSAVMVIPVAAAQLINPGFRATMHVAMLIGLLAAAGGISIAAQYNTAPGATIVLVAIAGFAALAMSGSAVKATRRPTGTIVVRHGMDNGSEEQPDVVLQQ